jgi:hypothetical protein
LKPVIEEKAKDRQKAGGGSGVSGKQKSAEPSQTREEVAKLAGVSHDTVRKVEIIEKEATPEVREAVRLTL